MIVSISMSISPPISKMRLIDSFCLYFSWIVLWSFRQFLEEASKKWLRKRRKKRVLVLQSFPLIFWQVWQLLFHLQAAQNYFWIWIKKTREYPKRSCKRLPIGRTILPKKLPFSFPAEIACLETKASASGESQFAAMSDNVARSSKSARCLCRCSANRLLWKLLIVCESSSEQCWNPSAKKTEEVMSLA